MVRQIGKRNLEVHSSADIVGLLPTIGAAAQINVARISVEVRQGIVTVARYQNGIGQSIANARRITPQPQLPGPATGDIYTSGGGTASASPGLNSDILLKTGQSVTKVVR